MSLPRSPRPPASSDQVLHLSLSIWGGGSLLRPSCSSRGLEIQRAAMEAPKPLRWTWEPPNILLPPMSLCHRVCLSGGAAGFLVQQPGTRPPLTAGLCRGRVGQRAQHAGPALRQGPKQMLQRWHRRESSGRCHCIHLPTSEPFQHAALF